MTNNIGVNNMEKFTIAERYTNENETPVQVGDKIKHLIHIKWNII